MVGQNAAVIAREIFVIVVLRGSLYVVLEFDIYTRLVLNSPASASPGLKVCTHHASLATRLLRTLFQSDLML